MRISVKRVNAALLFALWAAMFAGCGGGGANVGTSSISTLKHFALLTQPAATQATTMGNVSFAIAFRPKPKVTARRLAPQYVSASTQSLQILTDGNSVVVNLSRSSPNCSPNPATPGAYICTASLNVPTGNHIFTVTAFDLTDAKGKVLSTNSTGTVDVKTTGRTTVAMVLQGAVDYVILLLATANPPVGKAATIGLTAILEDADQNLIVGPAPYHDPVTLTTTDSTDGQLSKTQLNSPADVSGISANYTGAKVASITFSATATGLPGANVSTVVLTPGALVQHLYVANSANNSVSVFDTTHGNAVLPAITGGGLNAPLGLTVDASGKLYVANSGGDSVSIFDTAHGNAVLPAITGGGISFPTGVAIDASGKLYVSIGNGFGSVGVFDTAHGNAVLPTITGNGLTQPWDVALDASGKLYVACPAPGGNVSVFDTAHSNMPLPLISIIPGYQPEAVVVDTSGKLYVANYNAGPSREGNVEVFDTAHSDAAVLPDITGGGLNGPDGVAIDASGKLYVANLNTSTVSVFDTAHGNAVLPVITAGLSGPSGIALH
jgi:YVTN family beta-propeller protein